MATHAALMASHPTRVRMVAAQKLLHFPWVSRTWLLPQPSISRNATVHGYDFSHMFYYTREGGPSAHGSKNSEGLLDQS